MRRTALLLGLVLLTAGLAGCIGGDDDDVDTGSTDPLDTETNETDTENETEEEDLGPTITTTWHNATWEGASGPGFYYCSPPIGGCENSVSFPVTGGSSAVVAELAWEGDTEVYYEVADGNGSVIASDTSSSPIQLQVLEELPEDEDEWTATAWVDSSTPAEVEATFALSVVEDGEIPRQFSKVPATGS